MSSGTFYDTVNYSVFCQKLNEVNLQVIVKSKVLNSETTWDPLAFVLVIRFLFMG